MQIDYTDVNISFSLEGTAIQATNFSLDYFSQAVPSHSHGAGCYEIHYIPRGCGTLCSNGITYEITPNTLYVTGPHIEHSQIPLPENPMQEYCIYFRLQKPSRQDSPSPVTDAFLRTNFWFGRDRYGIHALLKQLFEEFEQRNTGYLLSVRLLGNYTLKLNSPPIRLDRACNFLAPHDKKTLSLLFRIFWCFGSRCHFSPPVAAFC